MKYLIIRSSVEEELEQLVNTAIARGWIPTGGVTVVAEESCGKKRLIYFQAVYNPQIS